jgi:ribose transport system substrate-binding protein
MRLEQPASARRPWRAALVALSLIVVGTTAACGSSESAAGDEPASDADSAAVVEKAEAFLEQYLTPPTTIPLTESLESPPEHGETIVFLQCELAQCNAIGQAVEIAADMVGWTFKTVPFDSTNPSTLAQAFDQALSYDPVAVSLIAAPYAVWSQEVERYREAGVPIIPSFTGEVPIDDTVIANPASAEYAELNGEILANWFISDSGAKGNVLSVSVKDFPYLGSVSQKFDETVESECPDCKLTQLNVGIPDVADGSINSIIVSALRKDPTIDYVVPVNAVFASALPSALAAAGLDGKVKVAGCCGDTTTEAGLATGDFSAITGVNGAYVGFITVDAAARAAQGLPIPANEGMLPVGLLVEGTDVEPSDSYNYPVDFVDQFKKFWKLD